MTFLQYTPDHTQMVAPGDTCTVCGHPTMSNYFTMYKIVAVIAGAYILLASYCWRNIQNSVFQKIDISHI